MVAEYRPVSTLGRLSGPESADVSSLERCHGLGNRFVSCLYDLETPSGEKYKMGTYILDVWWHLVSS
jgi:hypothetical protein